MVEWVSKPVERAQGIKVSAFIFFLIPLNRIKLCLCHRSTKCSKERVFNIDWIEYLFLCLISNPPRHKQGWCWLPCWKRRRGYSEGYIFLYLSVNSICWLESILLTQCSGADFTCSCLRSTFASHVGLILLHTAQTYREKSRNFYAFQGHILIIRMLLTYFHFLQIPNLHDLVCSSFQYSWI